MMKEQDISVYLDLVCSEVKAKELHPEIRLELEGHLEQLVMDKMADGAEKQEAISWAIRQMGNPEVVGKRLHKVHKPRIAWALLLMLIVFPVMSFIAMASIDSSLQGSVAHYIQFTEKQSIYIVLGLLIMTGLYFFDYRKLKHYWWVLYGIGVLGSLYILFSGVNVNGERRYLMLGNMGVNWGTVSMYLFLAATAALLSGEDIFKKYTSRYMRQGLLYILMALPAGLYIWVGWNTTLVMYIILCMVLFGLFTGKWIKVSIAAAVILLLMTALVWNDLGIRERLTAFVSPQSDALGAGYIYDQILTAIREAGWWGQGFGAIQSNIPGYFSELLPVYVIYSFGWSGGLILLGIVISFIVVLARLNRRIHDRFGKVLLTGISLSFSLFLVYGLAMAVGVVPVTNMDIPFLSYGGHLLVDYAAAGLLLSIYKQKDMIPRSDFRCMENQTQ